MGLDSCNVACAVFVSVAFSGIAIMLFKRQSVDQVSPHFSIYHLAAPNARERHAKLFHPKS
jgi:hypothetical protein